MSSERSIVNAIGRLLTRRGAWWIKTTGVAVTGTPDIIGAYRGQALALEVKQAGGRASKRQTYELGRAARAGAEAHIVRSADHVAAILDTIDQERC